MVFHLGALIRLNEVGILKRLALVSSVSGGSITAAMLGLRWSKLHFEGNVANNLHEEVIAPIRTMAGATIDAGSILGGLFGPGSIGERIAGAYRKHLFGEATLQDLPPDDSGPHFVIDATNVQSGVLWRFSREFMGDYLVGRISTPKVPLAVAVAASSAFPPFLSPCVLRLRQSDFTPDPNCPLQREPYTTRVTLTDGGVYDNLGLEPAWKRYKTILVSDGGGKMAAQERPGHNWFSQLRRVVDLVDNQVGSLRKRWLIESYGTPSVHDGAYWGIRTDIRNYGLADGLPCPEDKTLQLAGTKTRLQRMDDGLQERLINWGYAVCDAALRKHLQPSLAKPAGFPYPSAGV
jgi:NTE family protein